MTAKTRRWRYAVSVSVEVIDPRTLAPFDYESVRRGLERTNRLLVAEEAPSAGSWGTDLLASVVRSRSEVSDF